MPTILRFKGYRFFFYSNELGEPPHIHIQKENKVAKFWLNPITIAKSNKFNAKELKEIEKIIKQNLDELLGAWNEYFNK